MSITSVCLSICVHVYLKKLLMNDNQIAWIDRSCSCEVLNLGTGHVSRTVLSVFQRYEIPYIIFGHFRHM